MMKILSGIFGKPTDAIICICDFW